MIRYSNWLFTQFNDGSSRKKREKHTKYQIIHKLKILLTSGCSLTGTYTFSFRVTGVPSGSGSFSGSFLTPFIWNNDALTLAISANNSMKVRGKKTEKKIKREREKNKTKKRNVQ